MNDLSNYRKSYEKSELLESNIPEDPINLFNKWFHETEALGGFGEVNAMTVATIGLDGFPKSRVVLLKKFTEEGFIFYTNYNSEKGKAIAENPNICLSFFWHSMERQVIIKGVAQKTTEISSDNYFDSRPEGSKLGAVVSNQSEVVPSRDYLEENLQRLEKDLDSMVIPRPKYWGGY
jgi:pyridoxamine 5'-phosphate oxidase